MSENNTVARPYARAAFELAKAENNFDAWSKLLLGAKWMVQDKSFLELIKHPKFSDGLALAWMKEILKDALHDSGALFFKLLSENKRLVVLPEIFELFEAYRQAYEQSVQAFVFSAQPISDAYKKRIQGALKKRLGVNQVELNCEIDESLLAGALIRAGDIVIDGTAKGRLSRLGEALGV